ncbi:hypothetical protein [Nonomuraea sp. NPDC050405]|uniref:hypothetical protein n=1 Tax=Nonomuraea sp. NPDC050405 TaxID=3154509 RepID=UPI0034035F56
MHGVEELQACLFDAALPGDRHPVGPAHERLAGRVVDHVTEVDHPPLDAAAHDLAALLGGAAHPAHGADRGEPVAGQLQHDVLGQAAGDAGADPGAGDLAGREEAERVDDVDEVVEHRRGSSA